MKDHKAGFSLLLLSRGTGHAGGHVLGSRQHWPTPCLDVTVPVVWSVLVTLVSDT